MLFLKISIRIVSTNPAMNYDFRTGANNGDEPSTNEALETAKKIGTTGVVVWAVVLFFVVGLLCIFVCKLVACAKKKFGLKKEGQDSGDAETAVDHYKDYRQDDDDDELAKAVENLKKPPDTLVVEQTFIYRAKITTDV